MRRIVLALLAALLAALLPAAPLAAQHNRAHVDLSVDPATARATGPGVSSEDLLSDANTRQLLLRGFPARIHYRLELWRKGPWYSGDDQVGRVEWDVLVAYDPTRRLYDVFRRSSDDSVHEDFGGFQTLTSAEAQLARPFAAPLHPSRSGHYYYNLVVDVQTLTVSDLDALEQWWHGSTSGGASANPLNALRSGLGTLLSRVLGGSKVEYQKTSGVFAVP